MIGVDHIKTLIPHRYPVLLVDRVTAVEPGHSLVATKAITVAEPNYRAVPAGASAARYAYPLSLLLESWAQAAVLLVCWDSPNPDVVAGKVELAAGFRGLELGAPVYPGDVLEHHVFLHKAAGDAAVVGGHSTVDGRKVLSVAQFTAAMRGIEVLHRD